MKKSKRFQYYQPNKKDPKDTYGDCAIRAISKVLNLSWIETFDKLVPIMREEQCLINGLPLDVKKRIFGSLGFTYHGVSAAKGTKRPTVDGFAKDHPTGSYILRVAHHLVAVVDGQYHDTWDSGSCCLYGYFEKEVKA